MKSNLLVKSLLGAVIMSFLTLVFAEIAGESHNTRYYLWSVPAYFLIALVLGYYIVNSRHSGLRLCTQVFTIFYGIGFFNIMIEALIFNVSDRPETIDALVEGLFLTLLYSPLYVFMLGKWRGQPVSLNLVPHSIFKWVWKTLATVFLYFIIYIAAGMTLATVYPELLEFYEGKIPPFALIFKTQLFRGLIFAGIAVMVLRTTTLSPLKLAVLIGSVFSIIGGIAPLLPPNDLMPLNIRIGHGFEVGISNLVFGILASYLLIQKSETERSPTSRAETEQGQATILPQR